MKDWPPNIKRILFALVDASIMGIAIVLAFYVRLGRPIEPHYVTFLQTYLLPFILVKLSVFHLFGMYGRFWRYASIRELQLLVQSVAISSAAILVISYGFGSLPIPRTVFVIDAMLVLIMVSGVRLAGRAVTEGGLYRSFPPGSHRVLIAGAGDAGATLAKEMFKNPNLKFLPVGFMDDDPQKQKMRIHGVKVLGTREKLKEIINGHAVDEVIIAMPSVARDVKSEIVSTCETTNVKCRTLPGVYELIDGRAGIGEIRDIKIEDVLGRDPVTVSLDEIKDFIFGGTVMVTGAGGSIGSEMCRQISRLKPLLLVMVDIAENSLFEIEQELLEHETCPIVAAIADVKDAERMDELMRTCHPQTIFHAAAYKHVPLMEMNPQVALENNFIGTMTLAEAAARHQVKKFVLISTDKAVNPINVMGFSKALAEKTIASMPSENTEYVTVRFGNVLASNGSVVPIFQRKIAAGGPIAITHPDMKRYFMTIAESVQLVLQAAVFGRGKEVFVLDMGEQVSIVELAKKLIKLSGFKEDEIPIEYIGLRPGEKIEEELIADQEVKLTTAHEKIFKLQDSAPPIPADYFRELETLVDQGKTREAFSKISALFANAPILPMDRVSETQTSVAD